MVERRDFGAWLRRERERRGISLDAVAEQTKINIALLAGLERGDLARWPAGIFRRAFVRSYASVVGLDPDPVAAAFVQLFPEEGDDGVVSVPSFQHRAEHGDGLRLTLASGPTPSPRIWLVRAAAAMLDVLVITICAALVAITGLVSFSVVALSIAALYATAGTLLVESTPGWWFARRWLRVKPPVVVAEPALIVAADEDDDEHEPRRHPADMPLRAGRRDRRPSRHDRQRVARAAKRAV